MFLFKTATANVTTFPPEEDRANSATNINQSFNEQPAHAPGIKYSFISIIMRLS